MLVWQSDSPGDAARAEVAAIGRLAAECGATDVIEADDPDRAHRERVLQPAVEAIFDVAVSLGGTITGEHGVGMLKRAWLEREAGPVAMSVHRAVKAALDPLGILNPGKVFELA